MSRSRENTKTLEQLVAELSRGEKLFVVLKRVYSDVKSKRIKLTDPNPPKDFVEYFFRADYSLWLWSVAVLVVLTLLLVALTPIASWIVYARYVVGSIYVLFLPGYVTVEALYPREEDLSPLERLALSIGLSLAIVPLIGLVLNYTPWGIRLNPVLASLSIYTIAITLIATYRKYMVVVKSSLPKRT